MYRLTRGKFNRVTTIEFATGEIIHITCTGTGFRQGNLEMTIYIRGSVPKIDDESEILIDDYMEDFIQLGPESLFAFSSRLLTVDKNAIPYRY